MLHLSETTHNMYDEEHELRAVSKSTPDRHDSWKLMLKKTTNEEQKKEEKDKKKKKREKGKKRFTASNQLPCTNTYSDKKNIKNNTTILLVHDTFSNTSWTKCTQPLHTNPFSLFIISVSNNCIFAPLNTAP